MTNNTINLSRAQNVRRMLTFTLGVVLGMFITILVWWASLFLDDDERH